jgi:hypothetical protein
MTECITYQPIELQVLNVYTSLDHGMSIPRTHAIIVETQRIRKTVQGSSSAAMIVTLHLIPSLESFSDRTGVPINSAN